MLRLVSILCLLAALTLSSTAWAGGLGDCDGDGDIDGADAAVARDAVGTSDGDAGFVPEADMDGDGTISLTDVGAILQDSE